MRELEIYLHIPFCVRKCRYCDFLSFPAGEETVRAYYRRLAEEVRAFESTGAGEDGAEEVVSIYIGGGTPSLPDAALTGELLAAVSGRFSVRPDAEITIECNPGTLDREKLRAYRRAGINRLSLGLQSADDGLLKTLGRIHTFADFRQSLTLAAEEGFDNISADLMMGLPNQTPALWRQTLGQVLALPERAVLKHISAYSLIIEEGTPFCALYAEDAERRARGAAPQKLPDEDAVDEMCADTVRILGEAGLRRYEISNYAEPGFESRHNTGYWIRRPYAGFGLGAASLIGHERRRNTADLTAYLRGDFTPAERQTLTREEEIEETLFLGLRMTDGIDCAAFRETFGEGPEDIYPEVLPRLQEQGLIRRSGGRLKLTERGMDVSNVVLAEFLM